VAGERLSTRGFLDRKGAGKSQLDNAALLRIRCAWYDERPRKMLCQSLLFCVKIGKTRLARRFALYYRYSLLPQGAHPFRNQRFSAFTNGAPQSDDITMLSIGRLGNAASQAQAS
jgi:hypothetical protein